MEINSIQTGEVYFHRHLEKGVWFFLDLTKPRPDQDEPLCLTNGISAVQTPDAQNIIHKASPSLLSNAS